VGDPLSADGLPSLDEWTSEEPMLPPNYKQDEGDFVLKTGASPAMMAIAAFGALVTGVLILSVVGSVLMGGGATEEDVSTAPAAPEAPATPEAPVTPDVAAPAAGEGEGDPLEGEVPAEGEGIEGEEVVETAAAPVAKKAVAKKKAPVVEEAPPPPPPPPPVEKVVTPVAAPPPPPPPPPPDSSKKKRRGKK